MIQVPDGWELKLSSELCKGIADGTHDTPQPSFFGFNLVTSKNLKDNKLDFEDCYLISEEDYIAINKRSQVKQYDILFGMIGTIGNPVIILNKNIDFAIKNVGLFRFNGDYELAKWFYYYLSSEQFKNYLDFVLAGSSQKFVSLGMLRTLPILIPKEKKEQEKIAKILSTLDNAIESTNRIIEKEKNIKTALMQELLTNGIDKNGQIRTPQTHTYKQSELGLIPDEWEVMSLIDVTDKNNRYSFTGGPFGSDLKSSDYVERGVRVIQLQNIGDGEFKNNDFVYTLEQKAQELFSCQIFPNEIIMSKMGDPVGRACLIPNLEEKFIMCSDGIRIKVDLNKFDNYFIFLAINNTSFRNLIERVALGSTRKRIGLIELKTLKLKLPEFEEQKQIAKILTTQDKRIEMEETNLSKFKELKKGLMNDLLSGVVRVKV